MATSKHSEIEKKFEASHVELVPFQLWCTKHNPIKSENTSFPDNYYRRGESVVRHRMSGGAGVLTVKQRKSEDSITDRIEIDLTFGTGTTSRDVEEFIRATGWEHEVTLEKHFSHCYWFKHGDAKIALALYEVEPAGGGRVSRMLEVELEKESDVSDETAMSILNLWCSVLTEDLQLGEPLNMSLYELYSGKRYELEGNRSALECAFAIR